MMTRTKIAGLLLGAAALTGCASYGYSDGYYGDGDYYYGSGAAVDYHYHGGYGGYGYGPSYYGGYYGYPYSSYYGGYYGSYGYPYYYYAPRPPHRPPHDDDDNRPPPVRNPIGRYPGRERTQEEIDGRNVISRSTVYGPGRVTGDPAPRPTYGAPVGRPQGRAPAGTIRGGDAYGGTRPVGRIERPAPMADRPSAMPQARERAPAPIQQGRQGGGRESFESRRSEPMSRPAPPARVSAPAPSAERSRPSGMPRGRRDP